ncbi:MAG: hypothetical protein AAFN13_00065 [Bacteroidota bacterium]
MKPPPSIQRCGAVLLLALLTLPASGQSSDANPDAASDGTTFVQERVEEAVERLQLTPEQQEAAQPILMASMQTRLDILAGYGIDLSGESPIERPSRREGRRLRGELSDLNEATEAQLQDVLTEAQMDTWRAMQDENRERLQARFGGD